MPRPTSAWPFHGYVAGGPADDHEGTRAEDAIARVRQGMRAMLRLGSAWYDVAAQIKAVTEQGHRPAQLHPLHRRLPFRHAGQRRPHGPRRAPRHRAGAEAGDRDPDGDAQHRAAFRAGARDRLDRAGAAGRLPDRLRPARRCRSTRSIARGVQAGRGRQARASTFPPTTIRTAPRTRCKLGKKLDGGGLRHRRARGRQRGAGAGHRRHREPGADAGAGGRPRRSRTGWWRWTGATTSARSRWSSGIAAPARVINAFVSGFGYMRGLRDGLDGGA